MVRILANPQPMDGRSVGVAGCLHLGFEANHLCLHKDDIDYGIVPNCVWIDLPQWENLQAFSNHYVVVQGVLDGRPMNLSQARIGKVRSITVMRDPPSMSGRPQGGGR